MFYLQLTSLLSFHSITIYLDAIERYAEYWNSANDGGSEGLGWIGGTVKKMKIPPRIPIIEAGEEKYEFKDF